MKVELKVECLVGSWAVQLVVKMADKMGFLTVVLLVLGKVVKKVDAMAP
jgi:hypothetical protein